MSEENKQQKLTRKQEKFCHEYLVDFNGKQAAIRSGYSIKTAEYQASRLLSYDKVKQYIDLQSNENVKIIKSNQLKTLKEIEKLAFYDIRKCYDENGNLKKISEFEDNESSALSGIDTIRRRAGFDEFDTVDRLKMADKKSALELLAKIQGLINQKPELELSGDLTINITHDKNED